MALLRTRDDGTFQVSAIELTMDLSNLDTLEHRLEFTRENRRKSLVKNEDARIARQLAIEDAVLKRANRIASEKVEEQIPADPVRNQVYAEIPYQTLYRKAPKEVEKILDQEIVRREKERVKEAFRSIEKAKFNSAKEAIGNGPANQPAAEAGAGEGNHRERISLEALNIDRPARRPAQGQNQHAPQNQNAPQNQQNQHAEDQNDVPARKRRNSFS